MNRSSIFLLTVFTYLSIGSVFVSVPLNAKAQDNYCPQKMTKEKIYKLAQSVKSEFFPSLSENTFKIKEFKSSDYYLQLQSVFKNILVKENKRQFTLNINTQLYECAPSDKALIAILVHEFQHMEDFKLMSNEAFLNFGIRYLSNKKYHIEYERFTDLRALNKGQSFGLIEYRNWIYLRLNKKDLKTKKKNYMTPEEIQKYDVNKQEKP